MEAKCLAFAIANEAKKNTNLILVFRCIAPGDLTSEEAMTEIFQVTKKDITLAASYAPSLDNRHSAADLITT
jgi:hypothetical protein